MSETQIPVQVTITNDQIDKAIIDSLVGTQLGKNIASEIERCFGSGFGRVDVNSIVNGIVEKQIRDAVEKILVTDHAETIKAFVADKMTDEFVNAIFEKMWQRWDRP